MCGFTGFYALKSQRSRVEDRSITQSMCDALAHRGPDHHDVWQDENLSLNLGHRRLSILDLSAHGHQPMLSASDRYIIVFNGEIYNHLTLRRQYLPEHNFAGHSDTETLLALIEAIGFDETLDAINGMFAFALWDRKSRVLHFARDRFGKKPLYIGWAGDALVFGSELKAIRAHCDFKGEINREALSLYTRYNCVPAPNSIYKSVWQLMPGHMLSLNMNTLQKDADLRGLMRSYWRADDALDHARRKPYAPSNDVLIAEFEDVLSDCVKDRMLSDVPLGAFLSGGIDSSAIVALMQKHSSHPVHTYTIGFEETGFDESVYARDVAKHLGTHHNTYICSTRDAMDVIEKLPEIYDEPFADQSAIPTYMVAQFARHDVSVALSGDGGDEMFGGYSRHISTPKIAALPSFLHRGIDAIAPTLLKTLISTKPLLAKHLNKTSQIIAAKNREEIYDILLRNWDHTPVKSFEDARIDLSVHDGLNLCEQIMLWDTQHYLPNDILTKVDRSTMAVSLEARAPLLDRRIYDFAWRLPMDVKIRGNKGKWLLREVLARHVPRNLFERPKQGFGIPLADWLRTDLRDWAEDLLDEGALKEQGNFDVETVRDLWDDHLKNSHRHCDALWNILMFQAWHKNWQ